MTFAYLSYLRLRSTEELIQSEQKYRRLFDASDAGIALHEIICNETGKPVDYRFLEVNPAFEQLTGLKEQEIIGKTVLEVMPSTEPYWINLYGKVASSGEPISFESYSGELGPAPASARQPA